MGRWAAPAVFFLLVSSDLRGQDLPPIPQLLPRQWEILDPKLQQAYAKVMESPNDVESNGRLAMTFHAFDQFELAAVFYQRSDLLQSGTFRWPYYLGVVRGAEGKTSEAIGILRKARTVDPDYLPARVRLAELLLATHNQEEARTIYQQVLKQHPDCSQAHYGMGRVQSSMGQWQAAIQSYRRALTSSQGYGAAHYALATAYRQVGMLDKFQENIRLFQQNRERSPQLDDPLLKKVAALRSHAEYYFKEGLRLQEEGRFEPAIVEYQRALKEDPNYARAHANLCLAQLLLNRLDQAEHHCQLALQLDPDIHEIRHNLGLLRRLQGRNREAADAFREALEIDPFYAESHYLLGAILAQEERLKSAEHHFRQAIENQPDYRTAHFQLGLLLQKQGRDAEAVPHFRKTLTAEDERTPVYLYLLAHSYARLGDLDKAVESATQAREKALSVGKGKLAADLERFLQQLRQAGERP